MAVRVGSPAEGNTQETNTDANTDPAHQDVRSNSHRKSTSTLVQYLEDGVGTKNILATALSRAG